MVLATHIVNRVSTKSLNRMTPEEAWSGKKLSVENLKVFGCQVFMKQHRNKSKWEPRSKICMYLGPGNMIQSHQLWDVKMEHIIISRDVLFDKATVGLPKKSVTTQTLKITEQYIVDKVEPAAKPKDSSQEESGKVAPPSQVNLEIVENEENKLNLKDNQEEAIPEAVVPNVPSNNQLARSTTMKTVKSKRSS